MCTYRAAQNPNSRMVVGKWYRRKRAAHSRRKNVGRFSSARWKSEILVFGLYIFQAALCVFRTALCRILIRIRETSELLRLFRTAVGLLQG